jgi:tetrahydromethanopterin S-methyltransferase subunit C
MAQPLSEERQDDLTVAQLVRQLSDQTTALARQEVELAKAELTEKGKSAAFGAGMFGGAGVVGLYAVGALVAAAVLGLATAMDAWLAALIVGVVLAAVGGVLVLSGRAKVQSATPPLPQEAIETTREDVQEVKKRAQEGRA